MSNWELLKQRLNPPVEKQAEFKAFTPEFVAAYIKAAEAVNVTSDEAIKHLKELDDASGSN